MIRDFIITMWVIVGVYYSSKILIGSDAAKELYNILWLFLYLVACPMFIAFLFISITGIKSRKWRGLRNCISVNPLNIPIIQYF